MYAVLLGIPDCAHAAGHDGRLLERGEQLLPVLGEVVEDARVSGHAGGAP